MQRLFAGRATANRSRASSDGDHRDYALAQIHAVHRTTYQLEHRDVLVQPKTVSDSLIWLKAHCGYSRFNAGREPC
jgi:hypothetical protein